MSFSFPRVGIPRALGKYVAVFALVASGLTLGIAATASAAPTISEATGFPVSVETTGVSSIDITPAHVGDIVILSSQIHSQTITVSSVTSADTGTWQKAQSYVDGVNGVITEEIWWAVVTATTASTPVTVTYSGSITALAPELVVDSYTASVPSTWSAVSGNGAAATFSTTIAYPSVTSASGSAAQLYWGYAESTQSASAGSTTGFTYSATPEGNLVVHNPALAPSTAYAPTATMSPAGNTTSIAEIFAATQDSYTVTFNNNGGAGSLAAETDNSPTALSLFSTGTMTDAGFHFTGWNTNANGVGGTAYADGATYPFTSSVTLYAQWAANTSFTVTFNNNGGAGSLAAETDNSPTALSLFSTGTMTDAGFHFTGWNTNANGVGGTAYADGATYPFTSSVTLYAQWAANVGTATVTFNNNGGQGSLAPETASSPTALSLFSTGNMTQTNEYFTGWNTAMNGSGTRYPDGAIYPFSASVTLYAQWMLVNTGPTLLPLGITASSGTVSFGGSFTPSASVTAGLTAGDTAALSGTIFTYTGTGSTTYAASTTEPTAVGTYSVTPSGSTVTVTPAADQSKYSTHYAYVSGVLTITAPVLTVNAADVSIKVGGTVTPSAAVSGLGGTDTATVSTATYTYAGTGATSYPASTTAPTAAGIYSITPSAATVVVSPAADASNYAAAYSYVPGTLTITPAAKPPVVLHATRVIGSAVPGHRVKVTIVGTGFSGRPKITSSSRGTVVVVSGDTGTHLTVWVTVSKSTKSGHATLTIRLANGKTCKIGYVIK